MFRPAMIAGPASHHGRLLLMAMVLATGLGCGRERGTGGGEGGPDGPSRGAAGKPGRIVVIGVDGADWQVIRPLIHSGRLPNFARIVREGASGDLLSMEPSQSPALWTTIATGVSPAKHDIHGFVVGAAGHPGNGTGEEAVPGHPGGDSIRPVTSGMRRAPAFWNIVQEFDRRAGVVGWLVTWPAEPINGFIVSSYLPYVYNWSTGRPLKGTIVEGIPRQTYPEGLIDTLQALKVRPADLDPALLRRFYNPERIAGLRPEEMECVTGFQWSLASDETFRRAGRRLFADFPVDLFAVYFGGVDVASHRFWKFAHPDALPYGVRPADAALLGEVINSYYAYIDEIIGEYLRDLGSGDTLVLLSDHGFKPVIVPGRPTTSGHHRLEGIVALWGRGVRRGARIEGARLVDILPTLFLLLDIPLARTLEGRPLNGALDHAFVKAHPVRMVGEYAGWNAPGDAEGSEVDANVLERLRSLGYIN